MAPEDRRSRERLTAGLLVFCVVREMPRRTAGPGTRRHPTLPEARPYLSKPPHRREAVRSAAGLIRSGARDAGSAETRGPPAAAPDTRAGPDQAPLRPV